MGKKKTADYIQMCKDIGERLKLEREILGLTQEEMSFCLDISDRQYRRYEDGSCAIPHACLCKLGKFGISIDYLIVGVFNMDEYIQIALETMPDEMADKFIAELNSMQNYMNNPKEFDQHFCNYLNKVMFYGYSLWDAPKVRELPQINLFKNMHEKEKMSVYEFQKSLDEVLEKDTLYHPLFRFQQRPKEASNA